MYLTLLFNNKLEWYNDYIPSTLEEREIVKKKKKKKGPTFCFVLSSLFTVHLLEKITKHLIWIVERLEEEKFDWLEQLLQIVVVRILLNLFQTFISKSNIATKIYILRFLSWC
jgi:hypothetical protein